MNNLTDSGRFAVPYFVRIGAARHQPLSAQFRARTREYGLAAAISAAATALALPLAGHVHLINIVMIYVLGAALAGLLLGRGASAMAAVLNIVAFDFFFVAPRYHFEVAVPSYLVTFATMLIVALIIANLMIAVREQTAAATSRERHTAALYAIARELVMAQNAEAMIETATSHIGELLHRKARVQLCDGDGDAGIVVEDGRHLPLRSLHGIIAVLHIEALESPPLSGEQQRLLEAIADQLAVALERARMSREAQQAQLEAERSAVRNTLLASISHDLRTPLSAIAGAGSMVAQPNFSLDAHRRVTLGQMIEDTARDMSQLLSNVLELMRLEAGRDAIHRDWHSVVDLVGVAIKRNTASLAARAVGLDLPEDLPLVAVDASLIVQLLSNLLDNASKYTPAGTHITIAARRLPSSLQLSVEDDGPGLSGVAAEHLFEEFARGQLGGGRAAGVGLGLAICRVIARLHGGDIEARTAACGGARFELSLPLAADAESTHAAALTVGQ